MKSGRILEMEGERVRVRELALQAAAKRMSEAARIFRAGLPLVEGETGEAFHFPTDAENQNMANDDSVGTPPEDVAPVDDAAPVPSRGDNESIRLKAAGADAELLDVRSPTDEHLHRRHNRSDGWPVDRSDDGLHRRAVAAAEERIKKSQLETVVPGDCHLRNPYEAESRIGEDEGGSHQARVRARARIPQSSRLLSRPEKLQRTSDGSCINDSLTSANVEQHTTEGSSFPRQSQLSTVGSASRVASLEAALQRCQASKADKGKAKAEESSSPDATVPSSSVQVEPERSNLLRVRLEDGNVVQHTFPASTLLRAVRDSVLPEGAVASDYGFVVPFPEPHFVEGDALGATLEEVGLVPRGTIHLTKSATRAMVRQGRRKSRRRRYSEDSDDEEDLIEGMMRRLREHLDGRSYLSSLAGR